MDEKALEKKLEYVNGTLEVVCPSNPVAMYHFQVLPGYSSSVQNSEFYSHDYFGARNKNVTALCENMFHYRGLTV